MISTENMNSNRQGGDAGGLTLLELLLAMSILSVILVASMTLGLSAGRLTVMTTEGTQLHNQLRYVFQDMEINLKAGKDPVVTSVDCAPSGPCTQLQVNNEDGSFMASYTYDEGLRTLSKKIGSGGDPEILSSGVLVRKKDSSEQLMPPFVISPLSNNLVEINLAGKMTRPDGREINLGGMTKSVLLRGGGGE